METNELHRGRLIDHLHIVVGDLEASKRFYSAALSALGVPLGGEGPGFFWADDEVVYHGPATRSAEPVKVTFD